jgi:HD superfamily phosphodiesterase
MDTNALPSGELYVRKLFARFDKPYLLYHNLEHTERVVDHAREIALHYALPEDTMYVVLTAAWFHDTGHLLGNIAEHEELGVRIAQEFLYGKGVAQPIIDKVARCIMATKMPPRPATLAEMILCDADTYHLGTEAFLKTDALVWQELELRLGKTVDHQTQRSLQFLETHTYFTDYCRELLEEGKQLNIRYLKEILSAI